MERKGRKERKKRMSEPATVGCKEQVSLCSCRKCHLWTKAELLSALPHVQRLQDIFLETGTKEDTQLMDILKVAGCLRTMGAQFEERTLKMKLVQQLLRFPQVKLPTWVSFELVLVLYLEFPRPSETPTPAEMIKGLRTFDMNQDGLLPAAQVRRILTSSRDRLSEEEVNTLLDHMMDDEGNVNYVEMVGKLFAEEIERQQTFRQASFYLESIGKNAAITSMKERDQFVLALRALDVDKTGFVPPDRLLEVLNRNGGRFTASELAILTADMVDSKQLVEYSLLLRLIMND